MTRPDPDWTEAQMRDTDVPWPKTLDELMSYIQALVEREHGYGTSVYAMSMAATAAFYHVATTLGVTGFQASCADMDVLRRVRGMKHGFKIVDYHDVLYPQYWGKHNDAILRDALADDRARFQREARKLLDSMNGAAISVRQHWQRIADGETP